MKNFRDLQLPESMHKALEKMGFSKPTDIQQQSIPSTMEGLDVIGTAGTGTGKTGAFAIPLAAKLINHPDQSLLVMTPTRELALQVMSVFRDLLTFEQGIRSALLIGGNSITDQFRQLRNNPRVIVGTPGRINDHLKRGTLSLKKTHSLVLDETDLMLDMGFDVQIETIIEKMPKDRQTLMFSATMPSKIEGMAQRYLTDPVRFSVGKHSTPGKGIAQETLQTSDKTKYQDLIEQLDQRDGSIIIFVKTKRGADALSEKLNRMKFDSGAIHGDLKQNKRERVLMAFRKQKYRIMVATDVAARGIDIPHIRHVINYDLPQCPEDYIHRIGRTARAGETGTALSFITKSDRGKWSAIERLLNPDAKSDKPRGESNGKKPFKNNRKKKRFSPKRAENSFYNTDKLAEKPKRKNNRKGPVKGKPFKIKRGKKAEGARA